MSWQLGSFGLLALVLAGGFAWYERSRPPSQVLAAVAALAALAVAGRLLLTPVPNVVPTTDVVIFGGYALGAAPGFAIGSLAALISNIWLGQGPWTPWQMAGWGLCGLLGAALALRGRRLGRVGLAVACGAAGLAYGALLNFSLMVTYGGEVSLDRFLALSGRAVPFDLAHAIGNATLALVAGPALVRMLLRFRERFEWRWRPATAGTAAAVVLALALLPAAEARAASGPGAAAAWLARAQNPDGGFGTAPGEESNAEMTSWAMLGLEAAGRNPLDLRSGGRTPLDAMRRHADEIRSPGDLARTILALRGAGVDPSSFAGRNLVAELRARRRANGSYVGWPNSTAFAVLALRAAGSPGGVGRSLAWLRRVQNRDGGWGAVPGAPSDPDSTGAVLQAIRGSRSARRAVAYLRRNQRRGGGWALSGSLVNSQSTAWAMQGLLAAGVNPGSVREGGRSGHDYLAARQAADGHFRYSPSSDQTPVWVTGQALVAVKRRPYPIPPVPRALRANSASTTGAEDDGLGSRPPTRAPAGADGQRGAKGGGAAPEGTSERAPADEGNGDATASDTSARGGGPAPRSRDTATRPPKDRGDDGTGALAPIGLGLGAAGLALGATWWLGRRRGW